MSIIRSITLTLALVGLGQSAHAADFSDPTWPCIQRKVENLSVGLMWPHPVNPDAGQADAVFQADMADLADKLSLRRVELESLTGEVEAFASKYNGDPERLGLVFDRVFNALSKRRGRIIGGIGDFSLSQIALSEKIEAARTEMITLLDADEPDFDRVDALEEQIDWDQVIHSDRQRSITYLCETPTLLERRLFGIAQMLNQVVQDAG